MTTLPATLAEAEAMAWGRDWLATLRGGDFMGLGYPPLHPEVGRVFVRRVLQQAAGNPSLLLTLVDLARAGWEDADLALRDLILHYTNRGEPLPAFLATYNAEILTDRVAARPPGRRKSSNVVQDILIVTLVWELTTRFNLKPTRRSSRRPSGCSIAAIVLAEAGVHRGAEAAVQKIWQRYAPGVVAGWQSNGEEFQSPTVGN